MPLEKANRTSDFKPVPEGRYVFNNYQVIDLGTQTVEVSEKFGGGTKLQPKVLLGCELYGFDKNGEPTLVMEDGRPFYYKKIYTMSFGQMAKLPPFLSAWRGKPITKDEMEDAPKLLRSFCTLPGECVISWDKWRGTDGKERVTEVMASVSAPHPKTTIPKLQNDPIFFDMGQWDSDVFKTIPPWIREKIEQSEEFKAKDSFTSNVIPPTQSTAGMRPSNRNYPPLPDDFEDDLPPF